MALSSYIYTHKLENNGVKGMNFPTGTAKSNKQTAHNLHRAALLIQVQR